MFGPETFIVRIAEDAMAPRVRTGDYVWVDPDEPAVDGSIVAVRDPASGSLEPLGVGGTGNRMRIPVEIDHPFPNQSPVPEPTDH